MKKGEISFVREVQATNLELNLPLNSIQHTPCIAERPKLSPRPQRGHIKYVATMSHLQVIERRFAIGFPPQPSNT